MNIHIDKQGREYDDDDHNNSTQLNSTQLNSTQLNITEHNWTEPELLFVADAQADKQVVSN